MDNIKLSGMKKIRQERNISAEQVAANMNLLDVTTLNMVVTPGYIEQIENKKQESVDDRLLECLSNYFGVTIESLINPKKIQSKEEGKKKLKIIIPIEESNKDGEILIQISDKITNDFLKDYLTVFLPRVEKLLGPCKNNNDFEIYKHSLIDSFKYIENEPDLDSLMENKSIRKYLFNDLYYNIKYDYQIEIVRVAERMCMALSDSRMDSHYIITLVCQLIQMFLDNDML